jgi:predicted membrane metal-binding protein
MGVLAVAVASNLDRVESDLAWTVATPLLQIVGVVVVLFFLNVAKERQCWIAPVIIIISVIAALLGGLMTFGYLPVPDSWVLHLLQYTPLLIGVLLALRKEPS